MYDPILYAEDDANYVLLLRLALEEAAILNPLAVVRDGAEAIEYLETARHRPGRPCLVLTDLHMPKLDGFQVLAWMRHHQEFGSLPVVVLSSSVEENDRLRALELGAHQYFSKSSDLQALMELLKRSVPAAACPAAQGG